MPIPMVSGKASSENSRTSRISSEFAGGRVGSETLARTTTVTA
jgi:hypothetical protein